MSREYIEDLRRRAGIETISRKGGLLGIVRALKAGKLVLVAMDQHASKNDVTVEFFGRPARTVNVAAVLALQYGVPLVPAFTWREGSRFRGEILPEIEVKSSGNADGDIREITQRITDRVEQMVRKHSDQWLWMHRRWR
jgi:KDO2-lipid IV(A) lauroyltransferase